MKIIIEWDKEEITIWRKDNLDLTELIEILETVKEQLKDEQSPLCSI